MKTTLMMLLVLAGTVHAQSMNLLGVTSSMAVTTKATVESSGPDAFSVTMLARVIAAEAGGNWFSSLKAKTAIGGAMVNQVKKRFHVDALKAEHVQHILRTQPGFLSSWSRGSSLHHLYTRDAAWLSRNGYSQCLDAARAALAGSDPSHGATNWYDRSISAPYKPGAATSTGYIKTAGPTLVFYRWN